MRLLLAMFFVCSILGCRCEKPKPPWRDMMPESYVASDKSTVKKAYSEKFEDANPKEDLNVFLKRARQVASEWGANPDEVTTDGYTFKYEPFISVSEHFVLVIFQPAMNTSGDDVATTSVAITGLEITVMLKKSDESVVSIGSGS